MLRMLLLLLVCCVACNGFASDLSRIVDKGQDRSNGYSQYPKKNADIHKRAQRSAPVTIADIARFVDTSRPGKNYTVYCDDTMKRLIFRVVTFNATPTISATKPSGGPSTINPAVVKTFTNGSTITTLDIHLTNPATDFGNWTFTRNDTNTWEVTVHGESPVAIAHQFFEPGTHTLVQDNEIIASHTYRLVVTVAGASNIQSVEVGNMFSRNRLLLIKFVSLTSLSVSTYEASNTSILSEPFYVGIQGKDKSNHIFQRIDPIEIDPVLFRVDVTPANGSSMLVNTRTNVSYTITSYIRATNLKVIVNDTMGFIHQNNPVYNGLLNKDEQITGMFELQAGPSESSTTVKLMVTYKFGRSTVDGPVVQRTYNIRTKVSNVQSTQSILNPFQTSATTDSNKVSINPTQTSAKTGSNEVSVDSNCVKIPTIALIVGGSGIFLLMLTMPISVLVYKKMMTKGDAVRPAETEAKPTKTNNRGKTTDMPSKTNYIRKHTNRKRLHVHNMEF